MGLSAYKVSYHIPGTKISSKLLLKLTPYEPDTTNICMDAQDVKDLIEELEKNKDHDLATELKELWLSLKDENSEYMDFVVG